MNDADEVRRENHEKTPRLGFRETPAKAKLKVRADIVWLTSKCNSVALYLLIYTILTHKLSAIKLNPF